MSELRFQKDYVEPHLVKNHGAENVEHEKYLSYPDGGYGFADFWVQAGDVIHAIEVENDAGSIDQGFKQANKYAMTHDRAVPVVYIPADHTQNSLVRQWRTRIPIIEINTQ